MHDTFEGPESGGSRVTLHSVFAGPDGLRPGWGLLLFVILWQLFRALLYPLVLSATPRSHPPHSMTAPRLLAIEATAVLCVAIATWLMARLEGRAVREYGLIDRRALRRLAEGAAMGALLLSVLVLWMHGAGALAFDGRELSGTRAAGYGAAWFVAFLLVGFFEELLFRGYVQYTIARGARGICGHLGIRHPDACGFWIATLLTSVWFGLAHISNGGESAVGLVAAGGIGAVFCFSIWRTGSLWWAIGFHALWDWMESFTYGVADSGSVIQGHLLATHPVGRALLSGGATGPEGSILVLPVILFSAGAVLLTPRRQHDEAEHAPYPTAKSHTATDLSLH